MKEDEGKKRDKKNADKKREDKRYRKRKLKIREMERKKGIYACLEAERIYNVMRYLHNFCR